MALENVGSNPTSHPNSASLDQGIDRIATDDEAPGSNPGRGTTMRLWWNVDAQP